MDFKENESFVGLFKSKTISIVHQPQLSLANRSLLQQGTHETMPFSSAMKAVAGPASEKALLELTRQCPDFPEQHLWDDFTNVHCGNHDTSVWPTPIDSNRIQIVESVPLEDSPSLLQDPQDNKGHIESLNAALGHLLHGSPEAQAQPVMITPSPSVCSWSSHSQSTRKREFCMEYNSSGSSHDCGKPKDVGGELEHMLSQPLKRQRLTPTTNVEDTHNRDNVSPSLTGSETSSLMSASGHSSKTYNHSCQWYKNYYELCKFQEKHGHCIVPPKENYTLWRWIKRQRYLYKQMHHEGGGKSCTISNERIALLERLGFVWDAQGTLWMDRLNELAQYRSIHGHCNVPSRYPLNHQLSTWVKCQRRQYKLYCEKEEERCHTTEGATKHNSNMTPDRIEALLQLGFVFDPRSEIKTTTNFRER